MRSTLKGRWNRCCLNINILTIDGMCAYRHFSLQMIRYNDQQLVQVVMCTCKSALLKFRHAQDKGEQIRRLSGVWFLWDPCLIYMSCTRTHMHTYTYLHIESCFQDGDGNLDIQEYQVFTKASKSISKSKTVFGSSS